MLEKVTVWGSQEISFKTHSSGELILFPLCVVLSLKGGHQIGKKVVLRFPSDKLEPEAEGTGKADAGKRQQEDLQTPGQGSSLLPASAHGDFVGPWLPCAFCRSLLLEHTFS